MASKVSFDHSITMTKLSAVYDSFYGTSYKSIMLKIRFILGTSSPFVAKWKTYNVFSFRLVPDCQFTVFLPTSVFGVGRKTDCDISWSLLSFTFPTAISSHDFPADLILHTYIPYSSFCLVM